jgi:hypothetical protein
MYVSRDIMADKLIKAIKRISVDDPVGRQDAVTLKNGLQIIRSMILHDTDVTDLKKLDAIQPDANITKKLRKLIVDNNGTIISLIKKYMNGTQPTVVADAPSQPTVVNSAPSQPDASTHEPPQPTMITSIAPQESKDDSDDNNRRRHRWYRN